jgi:hypothetical protein
MALEALALFLPGFGAPIADPSLGTQYRRAFQMTSITAHAPLGRRRCFGHLSWPPLASSRKTCSSGFSADLLDEMVDWMPNPALADPLAMLETALKVQWLS